MGRFRKIISGSSRKQDSTKVLPNLNMQSSDTENSSMTTGSGDSKKSLVDENHPRILSDRSNSDSQHGKGFNKVQRTSNSSPDYFQMQMELAELRNRIKLLDNGTSKSELLDLLKEKDGELQKKTEQIQILNEKFHQITLGLDQMEEERRSLRQRSKLHQDEQSEMKRQLENREKEVQTLQLRCSTQLQKIKESSGATSTIRKLSHENQMLQEQIKKLEKDIEQIPHLQKSMLDVKLEKTKLKDALDKISADSAVEMEELRETVSRQNDKIKVHESNEDQMNKRLRSLEKEKKSMEASLKEEIELLKDEHEKKLDSFNRKFEEREVELKNMLSRERISFDEERQKSKEKSDKLESQLQTLQENHSETKTKMDKLEQECASKSDLTNTLNSNIEKRDKHISSLTQEIEVLKLENSVISNLELQVEELKKQNEEQKKDDMQSIQNLGNELNETKASYAKAQILINKYKENIKQNEAKDEELDKKLIHIENHMVAKNKLIAEKNTNIDSLKNEIRKIKLEAEEKSKKTRESEEQRQTEVKELKKQLSGALESERSARNRVDQIQKELDASEMQAAVIVNDLEEKLENNEKKQSLLERDSLEAKEEKDRLISEIQQQLTSSLNEKNALEKELKAKSDQMKIDFNRLDHDYLLKLAEKEKRLQNLEEKILEKDTNFSELILKLDKYRKEKRNVEVVNEELAQEIERLKLRSDEEVSAYQDELKELKSRIDRFHYQENSNKHKLDEMKAELEQRTKLLGDLVSHNKELDNDLREARSVVAELQEELNVYSKEKDESDHLREAKSQELAEIKEELSIRLNEEQDRCKNLELQLESSQHTLNINRMQSKDLMKKETENTALKDKIARQEAYIQRLLQKQKGNRRGKVSNASTIS